MCEFSSHVFFDYNLPNFGTIIFWVIEFSFICPEEDVVILWMYDDSRGQAANITSLHIDSLAFGCDCTTDFAMEYWISIGNKKNETRNTCGEPSTDFREHPIFQTRIFSSLAVVRTTWFPFEHMSCGWLGIWTMWHWSGPIPGSSDHACNLKLTST